MQDCVFCKIANNQVKADVLYTGEKVVAFKDLHPKAPMHLLIVPKIHVKDVSEVDADTWEEIRQTALYLAKENNLTGFRLINNYGTAQAVMHLHVHLLGNVEKEREL